MSKKTPLIVCSLLPLKPDLSIYLRAAVSCLRIGSHTQGYQWKFKKIVLLQRGPSACATDIKQRTDGFTPPKASNARHSKPKMGAAGISDTVLLYRGNVWTYEAQKVHEETRCT